MGQWVGALSGAALLGSGFLGWYGDPGAGGELTAWQAFSVTDLFCALAGIAGLSVGVIAATHASVSYPVAGSALATGAGLIALVLVAYRLLNPPGDGDLDLLAGAWIGLASSAGVVLGGVLGMKELPPLEAASAAR